MPAKRILTAALALLLVAAIPARAGSVPTLTVIDTINPGRGDSSAMDSSNSVAFNGYLYFSATDATHGAELWRTNGTTTMLLEDINPGAESSSPNYFTALDGYLYFYATDATHGQELWRTDGTTTQMVMDINQTIPTADPNSNPLANPETAGTVNLGSNPWFLTPLGAYLYFQADDGIRGYELWRSNGTTTELVMNIRDGADSSNPGPFTAFDGWLYFQATDATHGQELWRTNGTTTELFDIRGGSGSSNPRYFTALNGWLYFQATDATHGAELWRTNGTTTEIVMDINAGFSGTASSNLDGLTAFGGYLYFEATDGTHGYELWRTDGTTTQMVMDINSGAKDSFPYYFTALGGYLYFEATDGTHGAELWRTDGTTTTFVYDINTGADGSSPQYFIVLGDWLYFEASDGTHGNELWRSNGTVTERVPFPVAGQQISCNCYDTNLVAMGGRLYTSVYGDSDVGHEFAFLDEPTAVLPPTDREGSGWTTALVILAGLTAAASIGLRLRGAKRA